LLSEGTLAFQTPNNFRREIKGANPSTMVSNGQKLWIYYPNFKQAELYQLGQRAFFDESIAALTAGLNFHNVGEHYSVRAFREEPGYRVVLAPKSGGLKRMLRELTVWIDDELRMNKTLATLPKGDRIVTSYRNPKPRALPASTFEFTPPADAQVTQPLGR
jgi:outer membrane lipoprotein carrier protein